MSQFVTEDAVGEDADGGGRDDRAPPESDLRGIVALALQSKTAEVFGEE